VSKRSPIDEPIDPTEALRDRIHRLEERLTLLTIQLQRLVRQLQEAEQEEET